jgi:hypothetical protein
VASDKRRAQLEAPRLLLLRGGDGSEESFLRWHRARWMAFQQNLTADAAGFGLVPALTGPLSFGDGAVNGPERGFKLARFGFRLRQRCPEQRTI